MSLNNNERLAVLETEVKNINSTTEKILTKLDSFQNSFATKAEHQDNVNKIEENSKRVEKISEGLSSINIRIATVSSTVSGGFAVAMFLLEKLWK